jgi:hypothetical protein
MTAALIIQILQGLLVAEPTVVQAIHDLVVGTNSAADATTLAQDTIDWQAIQAASQAAINVTPISAVNKPVTPPTQG